MEGRATPNAADDSPASMATAISAAVTGAATERIMGAVLQGMEDSKSAMGAMSAKMDRVDAKIDKLYDRQDEIGRGLASHEVRLKNLEDARRSLASWVRDSAGWVFGGGVLIWSTLYLMHH